MKSESDDVLLKAIRTIAAGERFVARDIEQTLSADEGVQLSDRQRELLASITRGLSNDDIAQLLGISTSAVKQRLTVLFAKLGPLRQARRGQPHGSGRHRPQETAAQALSLDSSVECHTQRRREAESAENARNLANTMSYASNLLEAKHHLKGKTTNCSGHCDKTTNLQFSQYSLPLCASA